jgi:hypothetical protein
MTIEEKVSGFKEFDGTPKSYLWIAIIVSVVLNLYLYLGMVVIVHLVNGESWILGWKALLITALFTAFFARVAYRWIMRLDAQFGSGKGWTLESQMVKLPERAPRR